MTLENANGAREGAAAVDGNAWQPFLYIGNSEPATGFHYATAKVAERCHVNVERARLVCSLSGLGGAA